MGSRKKVGVLALQGDFERHLEMLRGMGVPCAEVRDRKDLARVGGLIIPGGETTTMDRLLRSSDPADAISGTRAKARATATGRRVARILGRLETAYGRPPWRPTHRPLPLAPLALTALPSTASVPSTRTILPL